MSEFYTADYVIGSVTLLAAILGLFSGFSGAFAFCAGLVAAAVGGVFSHEIIASFVSVQWAVTFAVLVVELVAFVGVRMLTRIAVKGLLAQPADAIFGSLVAAVTGGALSVVAVLAANCFMDAGIESSISVRALAVGERVFESLLTSWSTATAL